MTTTTLSGSLRATYHRWRLQRATRLALGQLNAYQLKDIGVVRVGDDFLSTNPEISFESLMTPDARKDNRASRHGNSNADGAFAWFAKQAVASRMVGFAALTAVAVGSLALATGMAQSAANSGSNWPSKSCGCSGGAGKCYIQYRNDGEDRCLPDGNAPKSCSGSCVFTSHPADNDSGGITRNQSTSRNAGGVLSQ